MFIVSLFMINCNIIKKTNTYFYLSDIMLGQSTKCRKISLYILHTLAKTFVRFIFWKVLYLIKLSNKEKGSRIRNIKIQFPCQSLKLYFSCQIK